MLSMPFLWPLSLPLATAAAESFHRGDFTCLPGDGQSEIPSAGVELQDAILFVKGAGVQEFGEHKPVGLGVDLGESVGVEFER